MTNKMWEITYKEIERTAKDVWVWLIFNENKNIVGRITARKTKNAVHIAFVMYTSYAKNVDSVNGLVNSPVCGYARMTGWGYDRINSGIAEVLNKNRDALLEIYGVTLNPVEWQLMGTWERDFTNSGYWIVQAL